MPTTTMSRQRSASTGNDRLAGFVHLGTVDGKPPQVPHADARDLTVEWQG